MKLCALFMFAFLAPALSSNDICDMCHCDFLDEKNVSPHSIICKCSSQHTEIHFRPKAPRMRNVTGIAIMDCHNIVFHESAFASTNTFNLHVSNVNTMEFKTNSMLGANMMNVVLQNVNNLILEASCIRQSKYDSVSLSNVYIPIIPNIANSEFIKIKNFLILKNVSIGLMHSAAVKTSLEGANNTIRVDNVTIEKMAGSAVNAAADLIHFQRTRFGATAAGFILQGKQKVTISQSVITRESQSDIMNIQSPFINMSDNTFIFTLPFHGDTVRPGGKFAKLIFNGNKIHDITYYVV